MTVNISGSNSRFNGGYLSGGSVNLNGKTIEIELGPNGVFRNAEWNGVKLPALTGPCKVSYTMEDLKALEPVSKREAVMEKAKPDSVVQIYSEAAKGKISSEQAAIRLSAILPSHRNPDAGLILWALVLAAVLWTIVVSNC